jgi:hypothetical protein
MTRSSLWVKESRIVWWPSTFPWAERRLMDICWLKWKITIYDGPMFEFPAFKTVAGWTGVGLLLAATFALWCISEGIWK